MAINRPEVGLYIGFMILMVILFYHKKEYFFRPRARDQIYTPEKHKHLVLFLSNLHPNIVASGGMPSELKSELSFKYLSEDLATIKKVKEEKGIRWLWEMPLRGIEHHLGVLESITIVCSEESILQVPIFIQICKKYAQLKEIEFYILKKKDSKNAHIEFFSEAHTEKQGYDFEDFDELSNAMWGLLKILRGNYDEKEIIIDITGGQKPNSIVGATVTFNSKVEVQYVQTNRLNVIGYDIVSASSDTGKLGI